MRQILLIATLSAAALPAALPAAFPACLPVTGSRILGRDLALVDPQYAALPATLVAGFNAEPGMTRILTAAELQRLSKANGIHVEYPADLCFEFPMLRLNEDDAVAVMRRALPPGAALKVLEIQSAPVPAGQLGFPLDGLEPSGVWRGYVKYAETRKAPFWARVAITVQYAAVIAATDLPADRPIPAGSVRLEQRTGPLQHEIAAIRIADVEGRAPKRSLKAGAVVPVALLTDPPAVHRGDPVRVEVRSGLARLHFDAVAEAPARQGTMIELRNPVNGKTFKARLDSPSTATILVGGDHPL